MELMSAHLQGAGSGTGPVDPARTAERPGPVPPIRIPLTESQIKAAVELLRDAIERCPLDDCELCDDATDVVLEMEWRRGLTLLGLDPAPKVRPAPTPYRSRGFDALAYISDGLRKALGLGRD